MPHQNNFLHFPIKKTKILFFLNEYLHLYLISFQISLFIMFTGTVKFYNEAKGFGFIIDDETQNDVFLHATGLVDKVTQNDKVSYEIKEGKKGPNAINVKKV